MPALIVIFNAMVTYDIYIQAVDVSVCLLLAAHKTQ